MLAESFVQAWNNAGLGDSILTNIVNIINNMLSGIVGIAERLQEAWTTGSLGTYVFMAIGTAVESVLSLIERISAAWAAVFSNDTTTAIFQTILIAVKNIADTISIVADNIKSAFSSTNMDVAIFTAVQNAISGVAATLQNLTFYLRNAFSGIDWTPFVQAAAALATAISNVVRAAANLSAGIIAQFGSALAAAFNSAIPTIINALAVALQFVANVLNMISPQGLLQIAAGIAAIVAAIKTINIISSITSAISTFTSALGGTTGIILVVSAAIAALAVAITGLIVAWKDLQNSLGDTSGLSTVATAVNATSGGTTSYSAVTYSDIPQLASGGTVRNGLFIAGERGPELITSQGGSSVVTNNQQIVDAVSAGVANALQPLVDSMQGQQKQTVRIRGNDLLYVMQKTQKQRGTTISNNFGFGGV